jgi:peptidoglycan/xylan/chitin deacetylase (PgdA/CDA1 family)
MGDEILHAQPHLSKPGSESTVHEKAIGRRDEFKFRGQVIPPIAHRTRDYRMIRLRINHWKNQLTDRHPKLLVLEYHRVLPEVHFNPFETVVSVRAFKTQLDRLERSYPIVPLGEAIRGIESKIKGDKVALTFDDGYEDNYNVAFPILEERGLKATFFVTTGLIGSERPQWDWEIVTNLRETNRDKVRIGKVTISKTSDESSTAFASRVIEHLKSSDLSSLQQVLEDLRENSPKGLDIESTRCMDWEEVRTLRKAGMEIGAHGVTHRSLARIDPAESFNEIVKSKEVVESKTGNSCEHFAFPFGSRLDYNQQLIDWIRKAGFKSCLLHVHGYNRESDSNFSLRRIMMCENTDARYLLG